MFEIQKINTAVAEYFTDSGIRYRMCKTGKQNGSEVGWLRPETGWVKVNCDKKEKNSEAGCWDNDFMIIN